MPIDKIMTSFDDAVADVFDGAVILIGGFGVIAGAPSFLIKALANQGARSLTVVGNSAGWGRKAQLALGREVPDWWDDVTLLVERRQVKKAIASFPVPASAKIITPFETQLRAGEVELEMVPQGTLAERIRANRSGIGAFYTPTGSGTIMENGKEIRTIDGRPQLLEYPIKADFAFVRAYKADRFGNLIYRGTSRTFNATMAGAAKITIAEVDEVVPDGTMDPEVVVTPALYVQRIVVRPEKARTTIVQKIS